MAPGDWMAFYSRSLQYLREGHEDLALADLDCVVALGPDDPRFKVLALYNRGLIHHRGGRLEQALADYSAALAVNPRYEPALNNRGEVLIRLRRHREAIADLSQAVALDPGSAAAQHNLGRAYGYVDDLAASLRHLDEAVRLGPSAEIVADRAALHLRLGHLEAAARDAGRALDLCPGHERAARVLSLARSVPAGMSRTHPARWDAARRRPAGKQSRGAPPLGDREVQARLDVLARLVDLVLSLGVGTEAEGRGDVQETVWRAMRAMRPLFKEADLLAPVAGVVRELRLSEARGFPGGDKAPLLLVGGTAVTAPPHVIDLPFVVLSVPVKEGQHVEQGQVLCRVGFIDARG